MRLGHKILLLTLALTFGLSAVVLWVVTARVTSRERSRAGADVRRVIGDFFENLSGKGAACAATVQLMTEEAAYRSQLALVDGEGGEEAQAFAVAQLDEEILGGTVAQVIRQQGMPPAFHVLISGAGEVLFASPIRNSGHTTPIPKQGVDWPYDEVLHAGAGIRRFVVLGDHVFLIFGIGLRKAIREPPSLAYFVGLRADSAWVRSLLPAEAEEAQTTLHAALLVGNQVTAHAGTGVQEGLTDQTIRGLPQWLAVATWIPVMTDGPVPNPATTAAPVTDDMPTSAAATAAGQNNARMGVVEFAAAGDSFLGQVVDVAQVPQGPVQLVVFGSLGQALRPLRQMQRLIAMVTALAAAVALLLSRIMSRFVAKPVEQLVAGTQRVARGEFGVPIDIHRSDELGELAGSFNQMAAGLEQRDLIKDTFGKFVDPKLVEGFLADPARLRLGGERRVQSILFSDLANFTSLAEQLTPEELVTLLNGYLGRVADIVTESAGIVDKFIGDAVVAFWGPPLSNEHAQQACHAALRMLDAGSALTARAEQLKTPPVFVRVGIATGEVLVGNIGSRTKYNYTVIGDVANLASRLEGINKLYGTRALATRAATQAAGAAVHWRVIDRVRVVGRAEAVDLCELMDVPDRQRDEWESRCAAYARARSLYERREWDAARHAFDSIASQWPHDGPARVMAGRCVVLVDHPPDSHWDGAWRLDQK